MNISEWDLFLRFGAALVIGFSIGLQREFSHGGSGKNIPAGERTFALLSLAGCLAAMASDQFQQPLIFFGLLLSVGLLLVIAAIGLAIEALAYAIGLLFDQIANLGPPWMLEVGRMFIPSNLSFCITLLVIAKIKSLIAYWVSRLSEKFIHT